MKKHFLYISALLLLAGCSADEITDNGTDGLVPIRLRSGIEVQTRAHTGLDAQFPAGRGVAFWVDNAANSAPMYGNNVLTSDGNDGFTGGVQMYFPQTGAVDIYAIHSGGTLAEAFPAAITHTVAADQTAAADYYKSDLLYAVNKGVSKTTANVPMKFYHLLSKVRIAIAGGTPETVLTGAKVEIVGTKTAADFRPSKTADMTVQADRAAMVAASGIAGAITLSTEPSADFTAAAVRYNDAVVVPQSVTGGTAFIRVTLSDNTVLEWKSTLPLTFESGKRYTYHVTVTRTGLKVSSVVTDWEDDLPEGVDIMPEANSYMAEPGGNPFLIPLSRANKATDPRYNLGADAAGLGGVTADNCTVELVWGDTPVGAGGVIKKMEVMEHSGQGYIYVEPGIAGNAVICVKVGDVIKWSWHIWVTEPVTYATDTETGLTWMDRNLGAGGAGSYQPGGRNGLFYQWGRKDAFPGSDGTDGSNNIQQYYTQDGGNTPTNANPTGEYTTFAGLAMNPLSYAVNSDTYYGSVSVPGEKNPSWSGMWGGKTIYDPCPPGWRVPPVSLYGTNSWGNASDWGEFTEMGRVFNGVNGTSSLDHFYPAAGYRPTYGQVIRYVGSSGGYWSATMSTGPLSYHYNVLSSTSGGTHASSRAYGFSVRCVAE